MSDDAGDVIVDTDVPGGPDGSVGVSRRSGRLPVAPVVVAVLAVVLGMLFWLLLAADGDRQATADTPLLNRPAPAAVGTEADGSTFELSRRKGSWVVLNFFTHNCVPCIQEHPELIEFVRQQRGLGTAGAEFYSVVQTSTRDEVEEYFAEYGGDWPIVYDDDYDFQLEFGVVQVPETWVIDPSGIVRGRIIGAIDDATELSASIQLLRESLGTGAGS